MERSSIGTYLFFLILFLSPLGFQSCTHRGPVTDAPVIFDRKPASEIDCAVLFASYPFLESMTDPRKIRQLILEAQSERLRNAPKSAKIQQELFENQKRIAQFLAKDAELKREAESIALAHSLIQAHRFSISSIEKEIALTDRLIQLNALEKIDNSHLHQQVEDLRNQARFDQESIDSYQKEQEAIIQSWTVDRLIPLNLDQSNLLQDLRTLAKQDRSPK